MLVPIFALDAARSSAVREPPVAAGSAPSVTVARNFPFFIGFLKWISSMPMRRRRS